MCGRFALAMIENLFTRLSVVEQGVELSPRYNIAPTNTVPVVRKGDSNHLELMRWGLIPHWAKDDRVGYRLINARSETVATKPMFKYLLKNKRCLVPANGFYEWREGDGKVPHYIHRADDDLFALAGLFDHWRDPEGNVIKSFIILTGEPNDTVGAIHDRMPVMLRREHEDAWVSMEELTVDTLREMFLPYPDEELEAYPVSRMVNDPHNEGEELIEPVGEAGQARMGDFP